MTIPNLKHLHALCAVAEYQNISKASEAVFLSQSAVSQAISKLSQRFKTPFLARQGTKIFLTNSAAAYTYRTKRAFELLKNGLDDILKTQNQSIQKSHYLLHHLTHTQLKAFVAVAQTNNYTHASKQIKTSQSSVYRSIQELHQLLGMPLFEKTSQGMQLNRQGRIFYQSCKLAISELKQGEMEIYLAQQKVVGKITLGCMPLVRHELLPHAINLFNKTHPKIDLSIIESSYENMLEKLRLGEIDFLIGALRPICHTPDILQEKLFNATLCIVADKEHKLARKRNVNIEDLLQYTWVLPAHGTPTRLRFHDMIDDHSVPKTKLTIIECSSMAMVRGLLKDSDRLALISRQQIGLELQFNLLTTIDYHFNDTPREIGLTCRQNWVGSDIHKIFLGCLRKAADNLTL